jgi:hypothetical protein
MLPQEVTSASLCESGGEESLHRAGVQMQSRPPRDWAAGATL